MRGQAGGSSDDSDLPQSRARSGSMILEHVLAAPAGDRSQEQLECIKGWLDSIRCPFVADLPESQVYSICRQLSLVSATQDDLICTDFSLTMHSL